MKVFPVVHINNTEAAVAQAKTALDLQADGVYLIDHAGRSDRVFETLDTLRTQRPESYIGVNLLGHTALEAILLTKQYADTNAHAIPSAIWTDDIRGNQRYDAELPKQLKDGNPTIAHVAILGGVAFKYTTGFTEDPDQAAEATRTLLHATDIVTTSGSGTGTPPSVAKIAAMKQAAGDKPLAIASGVSLANLEEYRTVADQILVASSVETAPYSGVFDKAKLKDFIEQAHEG